MQYKKHVIVNADDFGLHPSINLAIAEAHRSGIVTSTSLMPGAEYAPAFVHAIELLADLPDLDVGLHFTLVGAPGLPENHSAFLKSKLAGHFPSTRIDELLRRQIDVMLDAGVRISHVDSHQHLHALPSVMRVIAEVVGDYGIRAVRLPHESGNYAGASSARVMASKTLSLLCRISRAELVRKNLLTTDYFMGMAISGRLSPTSMRSLLQTAKPGTTEIVCHPGTSNRDLSAVFDWHFDWESEFKAVAEPAVVDTFSNSHCNPYTFSQLVVDNTAV